MVYKFYLFLEISFSFLFFMSGPHFFDCLFFFSILSFKIKFVGIWVYCLSQSLKFHELWFCKNNHGLEDLLEFA